MDYEKALKKARDDKNKWVKASKQGDLIRYDGEGYRFAPFEDGVEGYFRKLSSKKVYCAYQSKYGMMEIMVYPDTYESEGRMYKMNELYRNPSRAGKMLVEISRSLIKD